jgi:xanthine dehydrogenase accessory factor
MRPVAEILARLQADGALVRVSLASVRGSAPREEGADMLVFGDGSFTGTIGGGTLEWLALAEAQRLFQRDNARSTLRKSLGPDLGQCCGGQVTLQFERFAAAQKDELLQQLLRSKYNTPLLLFGAGHVGRALVMALAPLPFDVRWIDPRPAAFPQAVPGNVRIEAMHDPVVALASAGPGSLVAVMTHSHALDLAIVSAALGDPHFAYVGLIGSETKRARFTSQMRRAGMADAAIARLVCPIGSKEITGKEPAIIAAGIVLQLLLERQRIGAALLGDARDVG